MQQFRGVLVVSKPLLSLASYCTECTAARVLHTRIAGSVAHPASSLVADCQQPLWELLRSSTQLVAIQHRQPTSHSQSHCSHPHARSFASQSAHRLQQTLKRAKRAAQAHQGSKAATSPPHEDPASNSAVDSIPQSEAGVEASQERPTTLQVQDVVGHPALVITRNVEWGTVIFGFEQANKYTIYDQQGNVVALLAEELGSFGKEVGRQLLRTRRPFTATVFSPDGSQVIFRVQRPFYFINSSIYVEDGEGNTIGEVQQRWHLWQRNYDLYIDRKQYAATNGGLWAWEFLLKDKKGDPLALIDRNFQGFGKELFTDAGKYVIHFGDKPEEAAEQAANIVKAAHPDKPAPPVTAVAKYRNPRLQVIATSTADQLVVQRSLQLNERMIALAAAVSVDYDYFSQHSHGSGWFAPMMFPPVPYPSGGGAEGGAPEGEGSSQGEAVPGDAGVAGAGAAGSEAGAADDAEFGSPQPGSEFSNDPPSEGDLGGDSFDWDQAGSGGSEGELGTDMPGGGDDSEGGGLFSSIWDMVSDD